MALIDLTGQKFGRLTVLYRDLKAESLRKDRHAIWKCECECGNQTSVVGKDLRAGKSQSCGCLQKEQTSKSNSNNLLGQRFGLLTVIEQMPSQKHRTYWKCKCDCGIDIVICARELTRGDTNSCGCIISKGEARIKEILETNSYEYATQITFSDFRTENNRPYRFDFGIYENNDLKCLIEYNGRQHYQVFGGWCDQQCVELNIKRDIIKQNYCKQHKIPLLVIPFTDYNKINLKYLQERIDEVCTMDSSQK